jgi:hypothetical protein
MHITATLPQLQTTSIHDSKSIDGNLDWEINELSDAM